jgi:hypothetical protein
MAAKKKGGQVGVNQGNAVAQNPQAQAGAQALSAEEIYAGVEAGGAHDLGPWIETPSSTRVSRFRYDHLQRELQVQWTNNKNKGCVYRNVDYEGYRSFARVASKGKHVNSTLNGLSFDYMQGEEDFPSNEKRRGIGSRLRT